MSKTIQNYVESQQRIEAKLDKLLARDDRGAPAAFNPVEDGRERPFNGKPTFEDLQHARK
jgi:hypothetical protein